MKRVLICGRHEAVSFLALLLSFSCATTNGTERVCSRWVGMSFEEAKLVTADFEKENIGSLVPDPLQNPKSLDDVLEILKRDEIDLFPAGVTFASQQEGPKARMLQGQLELAWGDAQLVLARMFADLAADKEDKVRHLEASGDLTADQKAEMAKLLHKLERQRNIADALTRLAAEHVALGAVVAKKIIADNPNDYVGYRLAADYYRMRGDWPRFDEMVAKIKATNPNSNGLVFLRAMNAIDRQENVAEGQALLRQALAKDPKFSRAQAELVLTQGSISDKYAELKEFAKVNPRHQVVFWIGPQIELSFVKNIGQ